MGIAIPSGGYYDIESSSITGLPGVGIGAVAKYAGAKGIGYGKRVISKYFREALKTPSRAKGAGAGGGIGIALQTFSETGTSPTTGDEQQRSVGFNSSNYRRRSKYYNRNRLKYSKLCRRPTHMPCRCQN